MSLRYTLARCKEKKNHSKSAHISQRSFLYGGRVFDETITTQGTRKDEKTTDKRRKNEKRHNIRWMKGWRDYQTQWKVWQLTLANVICIWNTLTAEVNCHFKWNNNLWVIAECMCHDTEKKSSKRTCCKRSLRMLRQKKKKKKKEKRAIKFWIRFWYLYTCIHCVYAWEVHKLSCGCHSFTV